jgi:hypothetical protein
MNLPQVVSEAEWQAPREKLLAREKEATRARDALAAERRRLPMVKIEKEHSRSAGGAGVISSGRHALAMDDERASHLPAHRRSLRKRSSRRGTEPRRLRRCFFCAATCNDAVDAS